MKNSLSFMATKVSGAFPSNQPDGKIYSPQYSAVRFELTLMDLGAGPFVALECINDEPDVGGGENSHMMFFNNEDEVDQFCEVIKAFMQVSNEALEKVDNKDESI